MEHITGKSVIVTGASRGIGAATARAFARAGARVVLSARSAEAIDTIAGEIRKAGGVAVAQSADVAKWDDVAALVARARSEFGALDVLVNNAGVIEPIGPLAKSDPAAWGHAADINFKGTYHGLRAALPVMQRQGGGVIVNLSSGAATSPLEGWSHYCAAKAAAAMLTRCADRESPASIRVVGLSPGTVATEMQVRIRASGINPVSQLDPSVHIPAEWPAKAILWLCGPDAAEYAGTDVSLRDPEIRKRVGLVG
ncbi:SDR family NAD(P)-dependent oxidoreductase [Halovulum dunhuangense]|uniref:SDR family NAD(P)-dependent oxidoreductase n=1 Tax=Halovulum dunhuangense TaxID=1505036 RepID=A0A849KXE4_9RHOB|nr:SDR family NAD(P)-dependent oxidoreductase [Halovulum dunhuangense]NNU79207.1 SDR family NAD(P)-dependent oxidoreductase [Halovulum dunhuangense]